MPVCLLPIAKGTPIIIDKTILLVGRHPDCDVVLTHSLKVSRKHCCLVEAGTRHLVCDLGSLNGVWINSERVDRQQEMEIGDEVMIGDVTFVVQEMKSPSEKRTGADGGAAKSSAVSETPLQESAAPVWAHPAPRNGSPELANASPSDRIAGDLVLPADADQRDSGDVLPLAD